MADYDAEERREALSKGHALPGRDGAPPRFPINNCEDVRNAIHDLNRIPRSERPQVRRYIARRAVELGCHLPESWKVRHGNKD